MKKRCTGKLHTLKHSQGSLSIYAILVLMALTLGFASLIDIQNFFYMRAKLNDHVTVGAQYAASLHDPLSQTNQSTIKHLIKTGSLNNAAPLLTAAWADQNSYLHIQQTNHVNAANQVTSIIQITAQVFYHPVIIPFHLPIKVSHAEQLQTT